MAEAVVSMVVERLGDFLIEEAKLIHGVSEQVIDVRDELGWIQCFLKDADARHHKDHRVRTWIREIKEIAYDAGDVLESFIHKVEAKKGGGIVKILKRYACIVNEVIARHKVGSEIQDIQAKISKLTTRLQMYGIKSLSEDQESSSLTNQRGSQSGLSYSHIGQDDFVGMKADLDTLVVHLVDHEYPKVVSIWGMGGLGKTTLARQVFNHEKVRKHFDAFAWVCISQNWQHRDFFRQILTDLLPEDGEEIKKLTNDQMVTRLYSEQEGKKCLIVLDDIWDSEPWNKCLKDAFPIENMRGKLLLTSRYEKVAIQVNPQSFNHKPGTLQDNEAWDLLKKKALINSAQAGNEDMEEMEMLGRGMIKQCGSLPLAIVVLGGKLATKSSLKEWRTVSENVTSYIKSGERIGQQDKGIIMEVLSSSYDDLPYQLKPCFLYLGKFPEDSEIEAERLYLMWMAESMVLAEDQKEGESMMDVAERYLGELSQRCMVQVQLKENHEYGPRKFKSCRLHDIMRVFCLSKAREEDFFKVVEFRPDNDDKHVEFLSSTRINKPRRVVIFYEGHSTNGKDISLADNVSKNLRSIILFNAGGSKGRLHLVASSLVKNFSFLRVLAIEGIAFDNDESTESRKETMLSDALALVKAVDSLIYLRYLSLRKTQLPMVPLSLNNLKHLQTLDLRETPFPSLPNMQHALRKMIRLQHLYLPEADEDSNYAEKLRLDGLINLETLENFDPFWCEVEDLCKLERLQKLIPIIQEEDLNGANGIISYLVSPNAKHIRYSSLSIHDCDFGLEKWHAILVRLLGCGRLHELEIDCSLRDKLPRFDDISKFSSSLTVLTLVKCKLKEDPMPTLERLPNLQSLSLNNVFTGEVMVCSESWFRELKSLDITGFYYLREWIVEDGALPKLSSLRLEDMRNLKTIPDGLKFISTLLELRICRMRGTEFQKRIMEVKNGDKGEDFERIRHVRSIIIEDS